MKIAIIILHFGLLKTTQGCVDSILNNEKGNFDTIYIVNNDIKKITEKDFGQKEHISIINNFRNLGFAAGVNVGIIAALKDGADRVFLINNDTKISKPIVPSLEEDLEENEHIGAISPTIEFRKGTHIFFDMGGYINMRIGKTHHMNVEKIETRELQYPDYISGCCMLIRSGVFLTNGFFDDRFFLYYEDVDFCLRMKKKGWEIALDPNVMLFHSLSKSAGRGSRVALYHQTRSALLFGEKYFGHSLKRFFNLLFIFSQSTRFFFKNPTNGYSTFVAIADVMAKKQL